MEYTQFLIFEACRGCNLATEHTRCPSSDLERWARVDTSRKLSDPLVVETARRAYHDHNFRGLVGFHYYNEPTLVYDRLLFLIHRIREVVPWAGFVLWTNGTRLHPGMEELDVWAQIWITNYRNQDWGWLHGNGPRVTVLGGGLDGRRGRAPHSAKACLRMFNELIFDFYGNARICCMDWRGEAPIGNLHDEPLHVILERFRAIRRAARRQPMGPDVPACCFTCPGRQYGIVDMVRTVADETRKHLEGQP